MSQACLSHKSPFDNPSSITHLSPRQPVPLTSCYHDSALIQRQPLIWQRTKQQTDVGIVMQSVPSLLLFPPSSSLSQRGEKKQPAPALQPQTPLKKRATKSLSSSRRCWNFETAVTVSEQVDSLVTSLWLSSGGQGWLKDTEVKPVSKQH